MSHGGKHLVALMPGVAWKWGFFSSHAVFCLLRNFED